jgi:hypothetical protein
MPVYNNCHHLQTSRLRMNNSSVDTVKIENLIDLYIQGRLNEEEIDKVWVELILSDEIFDYLKTRTTLHSLS